MLVFDDFFLTRSKISVNTDISVIGFYEYISKISMEIFTKIYVSLKLYIYIYNFNIYVHLILLINL